MKISIASTLLFLTLSLNLSGQNTWSKALILEDLLFLNEAVKKGHPINYLDEESPKYHLDAFINAFKLDDKKTYLEHETYWVFRRALSEIGCSHTSILRHPYLENVERQYFPYELRIYEDALFVLLSSQIQKVLSINGLPSAKIIKDIQLYHPSDGVGPFAGSQLFYNTSREWISSYFIFPDSYNVLTDQTKLTLEAIKQVDSSQNESLYDVKNGNNTLLFEGNTATLTLKKFRKSDKRFFKRVFEEIQKQESNILILDLRDNQGGDRGAGQVLTKHLVDTVFSYKIVEPSLKPFPYLSTKGKCQHALSRIKYFTRDLYRLRKDRQGFYFKFSKKPAKKHFSGNIYVLINGLTGSTSTMCTSWLKQYSAATFIGTPCIGGYNGNNGASFPELSLTNTGIKVRFPTYRLVLDETSDQLTSLIPDYIIKEPVPFAHKNQDAYKQKLAELMAKKKI